jgi:adenylate kinase
VALSGTPGTGKSSVARRLSSRFSVAEVGDLALQLGLGTRTRSGVQVDMAALSGWIRRNRPESGVSVVVGHLSHLLPIPDVIVLRCRPDVLVRRLRTSRRGSARDRKENYLAEALDIVVAEAVGLGRRVWEVDTTGRSVASVTREVEELILRRPGSKFGSVDWLSDPRVAAHLLDPPA